MESPKQKSVLITGGSRGIGRAIALLAAKHQWRVAVNYLGNDDAATKTVEIARSLGAEALSVAGDVSQENDVLRVFDKAEEVFGHLDAVVINAGIVAPSMPLHDMPMERLRKVFDINILGAFLCAREATRRLPRSPRTDRSIVLVSSAAARLGSPFEYVDYAASKGAIDTLTIGLAKEVADRGIRVNAVRPGLIETEIHASGGQPDRAVRLGSQVPMGRPGRAEEVAEAILWLMDDRSSYATGSIIDIAGGR